MSVSQLNEFATTVCEGSVNILYSRIDENNHTGKLVVDRLEDYNKLKSNTGDVSFYRFAPLNVPRNNRNENVQSNSSEWQTVQPRRQTVQGRYAQVVSGAPADVPVSAPVAQAPVRGARAPRGGATRGRGRPARSAGAPAPSSA
jgi:hypothetical protein